MLEYDWVNYRYVLFHQERVRKEKRSCRRTKNAVMLDRNAVLMTPGGRKFNGFQCQNHCVEVAEIFCSYKRYVRTVSSRITAIVSGDGRQLGGQTVHSAH